MCDSWLSRGAATLLLASALAACGGTTTTDAGGPDASAEGPDAFAEGPDAAQPTDAGAPMCPSPQTGGYTFEGKIPSSCPPGTGTSTWSVNVGFEPASCVVSFATTSSSDYLLKVMGMGTLSSDGTLGPTTLSLNDVGTTCTVTYMDGSPQRFAFDCGDCDFTIRYGE